MVGKLALVGMAAWDRVLYVRCEVDIAKLTPTPVTVKHSPKIDLMPGIWARNGNVDFKIADVRNEDDAELFALARNAFDIQMRRGWFASPWWQQEFNGQKINSGWGLDKSLWENHRYKPWVRFCEDMIYDDPFTALVEADAWFKANVENK